MRTSERVTAYHEAGHIAVQLSNRCKFKYVTIIQKDGALGHWKTSGYPRHDMISDFYNSLVPLLCEAKITKTNFLKRYSFKDHFYDCDKVIKYFQRNFVPEYNPKIKDTFPNWKPCYNKMLFNFLVETRRFTNGNWNRISSIAETLLEKKTLNYGECLNLWKRGKWIEPKNTRYVGVKK